MICEIDIIRLKANLGDKLGQKIIVKGSLGRSRPFEKEATIENTYPAYFRIKYDNEGWNENYTYGDVLTRVIEVDVFDGEQFSPLLPPLEQKKKKEIL